MLKQYLIVSFAYLVKIGRWNLEAAEENSDKTVPDDYRLAVAEYLAQQGFTGRV